MENFNGAIILQSGRGGNAENEFRAYSMIGHGGAEGDGNHSGNIRVHATENAAGDGIVLEGGDQRLSPVRSCHAQTQFK